MSQLESVSSSTLSLVLQLENNSPSTQESWSQLEGNLSSTQDSWLLLEPLMLAVMLPVTNNPKDLSTWPD